MLFYRKYFISVGYWTVIWEEWFVFGTKKLQHFPCLWSTNSDNRAFFRAISCFTSYKSDIQFLCCLLINNRFKMESGRLISNWKWHKVLITMPKAMVKSSNVKTVKEQTFHKHSTNVPKSNRNEPKSLFPNLPHRKRLFLFGPGEQILDKFKRSVFNKTNSGTIPKSFGFVSKTI